MVWRTNERSTHGKKIPKKSCRPLQESGGLQERRCFQVVLFQGERGRQGVLRSLGSKLPERRYCSRHFPGGKFFIVTLLLFYGFLSFATSVIRYMLGPGYQRSTCSWWILGMNIRGSYIPWG